ncbi:MAG: 3-phosphoserine/phosphohydroxythreonine transaminase [Eggerthellaceae bacterium]|nr:3-phosphoserine/phosphohydroxythreonine transaminase [Eggerthellaceae bacterium]
MARVYNFAAGPATLPEEVLAEAAADLMDYKGSGMSVMEMSHRGKEFKKIYADACQDLRDLLAIPDNYQIIMSQGGATCEFAMIPMNLFKNGVADYIVTGSWSKKAAKEAKAYGKVNVIASSEDQNFSYVPDCSDLPIDEDADYVYICQNETIHGNAFHTLPNTKGKVLVSDVSSMYLSGPMEVEKYGVIYGGIQKNIGPAGMAIAIVRDDLIADEVWPGTPTMLRWKTYTDNDNMYNTPNCWAIYMCGLVFRWLKSIGGLEAMYARNVEKAQILYDFLDQSELFKGSVRKEDRSIMNVPFVTGDADMDAKFVAEAAKAGLVQLKGHRSVGGMRASIYNAMPKAGVEKLVDFMAEFEKANK